MVSKPLDMKYIYKRERYLERRKTLSESASLVPDLSTIKSPELYRNKVSKYVSECTSYRDALNVLESLYENDKFNLLEEEVQMMASNVIPMVENAELSNCIDAIRESNIGEINRDRLIEEAKAYKSIDRIRKNHRNLSKRFGMDENCSLHKSDKARCNTICEMVDTYTLTPFIKLNIALEEMTYLNYYEGRAMDESSMVKNIVDYFLLRENNTEEDVASYKRAIVESKVLTENAASKINYLMNGISESNNWEDEVNKWKVNPDKNVGSIIEFARNSFDNKEALRGIIDAINEYADINGLEFDPSIIFEDMESINGDEAENILSIFSENNIEGSDVADSIHSIWEAELNDEVYADGNKEPMSFTSDEIDKFKLHDLITDAQEVGEFLDQSEKSSMKEKNLGIQVSDAGCEANKINESNVLDYADSNGYISFNVRSYVYEGKLEDIKDLLESTISCINNCLYNRNSKAYFVHRENGFDICLRTKYDVLLSESQLHQRGFSNTEKGLICNLSEYASAAENLLESPIVAIMDKLQDRKYAANIGVDEAVLVYDILNPYLGEESNIMDEFFELCKEESNPKYDNIVEACSVIKHEEFDPYEDLNARLEFCAYDVMGLDEGVVDKAKENLTNAVNSVKNKFKKDPNAVQQANSQQKPVNSKDNFDVEGDKKVAAAENNVKPAKAAKPNTNAAEEEEVDDEEPEVQTNSKTKAVSKDSSSKAKSDDKVEAKGSEIKDADGKKGLSLNDAKLAWQGVKSKLKGASAKEQEMCRDLDMEFNHLCKNLNSTFGVDHREEIITGQVNRSLSRAIKIAIALAATGGATSMAFGINPIIAPIVGAITIFAKNKHTSDKEKRLILDEIDIELQVLEREINRAEASGSTKKYRELLSIQKNLQRRRQEIYYGLAKQGKRIPMAPTAGMRGRE